MLVLLVLLVLRLLLTHTVCTADDCLVRRNWQLRGQEREYWDVCADCAAAGGGEALSLAPILSMD